MLVLMANNIDGWAIAMDVKATCDGGLALQEMNMKLLFQEKGKAYKIQAQHYYSYHYCFYTISLLMHTTRVPRCPCYLWLRVLTDWT